MSFVEQQLRKWSTNQTKHADVNICGSNNSIHPDEELNYTGESEFTVTEVCMCVYMYMYMYMRGCDLSVQFCCMLSEL